MLKLFIMDVDGVLTDAGMYYSQNGDELKKFPKVVDFISDSELYLCTSGTPGELDTLNEFGFFEKFNPTRMIRPYLGEISETHIHLQNSTHLNDTYLSNVHKKYMYQIENHKYPYTYLHTRVYTYTHYICIY